MAAEKNVDFPTLVFPNKPICIKNNHNNALISIPKVFNFVSCKDYLLKIITGNPGTGKHTISRMVARILDLNIVDINEIVINEGIFEKNQGTFDVDVEKLRRIINKRSTMNSLLVGHLAPYVISPKKVEIAVVLRKSPYKLQYIYKKRKYSKKKSVENLGSEILGVIYYDTIHAFGRKKTFQIDTTDQSVASVTKKVEYVFSGRRNEERVDWLQLILKKGDMFRFFPY